MSKISLKLLTKNTVNKQFECGVESINQYVKNAFYPLLLQQAYTYTIESNNIVLGYVQIMFKTVKLTDFPEEISEYYDDTLIVDKIVTMHIKYLAIDTKYQKKQIGTSALRSIIKIIEECAELCPIKVITIDALVNLVPWYKKEGFRELINNTIGQDGVTTAMYFKITKYEDELQEYLNNIIEL